MTIEGAGESGIAKVSRRFLKLGTAHAGNLLRFCGFAGRNRIGSSTVDWSRGKINPSRDY
ncbi:MAG TPA: hypothetical protein VLL57_00145 [Candidatus Binataceae bacterium]|nr:hypothetical protein [Candidatus Binataceae bacterium]